MTLGSTSMSSMEPVDLTLENMVALVDTAAEAERQNTLIVVAVYTLPKGAGFDIGPSHGIGPARPLGLNGIPPGGRSAIYNFPLPPDSTHFRDDKHALQLVDERFAWATQVQAVAAMSNTIYANAVQSFEMSNNLSDEAK